MRVLAPVKLDFMKHTKSIVLVASLFTCFSSFGATELAKVNGKTITLEDFNKKYQALMPLYSNKAPTKSNVLEDLIKREIGIQEAKKLKLEQDPDVQDEMNTVLYQALLRKQLAKEFQKIQISDAEAKSWYEKNPEIRTSHIFVAVKAGAKKEEEQGAYKRIKEIQDKELKSGKSFAEVAQKFSEGVAAPMGGDLDYQTKDRLDPTYYSTALALKSPGKISGIIKTQFGYHIIKLTAVREWVDTDHATVKQLMFNEKRQGIFEHYMNGLRAKANVSIKSGVL